MTNKLLTLASLATAPEIRHRLVPLESKKPCSITRKAFNDTEGDGGEMF
jgi:hypothetical protein